MRCNNRGQMAGYEALIIIVLLGAFGWMFYLYAHKPSESSIYQSGSKPVVTDINNHPLCGAIFDINRGYDANVNTKVSK